MGSTAVARWTYSTAKSVDEILGFAYHQERGLDVVIARFFNTVGPRQTAEYGMVIPTLVAKPSPECADGSRQRRQTRCFCHVHDTVRAILGLLQDERARRRLQRGLERRDQHASSRGANHRDRRKQITDPARPIRRGVRRGFEDMLRRVPDTGKLRALTGWRPTRTLTDILEESIVEARREAKQARRQSGSDGARTRAGRSCGRWRRVRLGVHKRRSPSSWYSQSCRRCAASPW